MDRDDDIWERMLLWTAERTGLRCAEIESVFEISTAFWEQHLGLANMFGTEEDE